MTEEDHESDGDKKRYTGKFGGRKEMGEMI